MTVLYVLVPLALAMASAFVAAFVWATRQGQFDDLETPAVRILVDDRPVARGTVARSSRTGLGDEPGN